jgi:hypothetical protein
MNAFGFIIYAILIVVGGSGALIFPIMYTIKFHWWKSEVGIHVFAFSGLFAVLYTRSLIGLFNPISRHALADQSTGNLVFTFIVITVAALVVWQQIWIFIKARREEKKERGGEKR